MLYITFCQHMIILSDKGTTVQLIIILFKEVSFITVLK